MPHTQPADTPHQSAPSLLAAFGVAILGICITLPCLAVVGVLTALGLFAVLLLAAGSTLWIKIKKWA